MPETPALQIPLPPWFAIVDEHGQFPIFRKDTLPVWTSRRRAEQFLDVSDAPAARVGELPTASRAHEILSDVVQDSAEFVAVDPQNDSGDRDGVVLPMDEVIRLLADELPAALAP